MGGAIATEGGTRPSHSLSIGYISIQQFMALFCYNDTAAVIRAIKKEEKKSPWFLVLASTIPTLDLEGVCSQKFCLWPWPGIFFDSLVLALASNVVSSNSPLL